MREARVRANGLDFAYLEEGSGPLLLCLHGFPDVAWSWERQIPPFAAARSTQASKYDSAQVRYFASPVSMYAFKASVVECKFSGLSPTISV